MANWNYPTVEEEFSLYQQGYGYLAVWVDREVVSLSASKGTLVAYEVDTDRKVIVLHAAVPLEDTSTEDAFAEAIKYLKAECEVWQCNGVELTDDNSKIPTTARKGGPGLGPTGY